MSDGAKDTSGQHIFVLNTAPTVLDLVRQFLEGEGYTVSTSTFSPGALAPIAAERPDLLIIDVAVGEFTAWELLDQLQADADLRAIPVIITSTSRQLLDEARRLETGRRRYSLLAKLFDLATLLILVEELIGVA